MADNFVDSPMKPCAPVPSNYKGGPGHYDGLDGLPKRTPSPNGAPEKVCEDTTGSKDLNVDTPIEKIDLGRP